MSQQTKSYPTFSYTRAQSISNIFKSIIILFTTFRFAPLILECRQGLLMRFAGGLNFQHHVSTSKKMHKITRKGQPERDRYCRCLSTCSFLCCFDCRVDFESCCFSNAKVSGSVRPPWPWFRPNHAHYVQHYTTTYQPTLRERENRIQYTRHIHAFACRSIASSSSLLYRSVVTFGCGASPTQPQRVASIHIPSRPHTSRDTSTTHTRAPSPISHAGTNRRRRSRRRRRHRFDHCAAPFQHSNRRTPPPTQPTPPTHHRHQPRRPQRRQITYSYCTVYLSWTRVVRSCRRVIKRAVLTSTNMSNK